MKRWQADLVFVGIALIWGGTFVMVKNALGAVGPATFIGLRFVVASLVMAVLFGRRMLSVSRREVRWGILVGVWLGLGFTLQTTGLQTTTTGKTGFITGLSVVIVPVAAAVLFRKLPGRGQVAGILAATVGLALLTLGDDLSLQTGDLWVLGGAVCFAMHILSVSRVPHDYDAVRVAVVQIVTASLMVMGVAFVFESPTLSLPAETWRAIVFMGAVATALVFGVQVAVQRYTTETHAALIFSLESPFAAFFGWWWAREMLSPRELAGCALIMAGIVIAEVASGSAETSRQESASRA